MMDYVINARLQLEAILKTLDTKIDQARVDFYDCGEGKDIRLFLPRWYTQIQYDEFMNGLDFNYRYDIGGEPLYAYIILSSNKYLITHEYDGSTEYRLYEPFMGLFTNPAGRDICVSHCDYKVKVYE
jgi:hypothetical protein